MDVEDGRNYCTDDVQLDATSDYTYEGAHQKSGENYLSSAFMIFSTPTPVHAHGSPEQKRLWDSRHLNC